MVYIIHKKLHFVLIFYALANSIPLKERLAAMEEARSAMKKRKQICKHLHSICVITKTRERFDVSC